MTTTHGTPTITTDGITVTRSASNPAYYEVTGPRVTGTVEASLFIDERGGDEYTNGRVIHVPTPVVSTQVGYRSERGTGVHLTVNGIDYVGCYDRTASGRFVGSTIDRKDGKAVTDNARATIHALASAVATLHATPANIAARKLSDAEQAVKSADAAMTAARETLVAARLALRALKAEQAN